MSSERQRTARLVTTPEAGQTLIVWRRRFNAEAVRGGVPAHLTALSA